MDKKKVLIIDDEKLLVKTTALALKYRGFETKGASDGPEGLSTAGEFNPDVILLDIMMPGMDGWEVLSRLRAEEKMRTIPVIIFTAKEYSNGRAMARERGADDFVAKPFETDDLAELIKSCINRN